MCSGQDRSAVNLAELKLLDCLGISGVEGQKAKGMAYCAGDGS